MLPCSLIKPNIGESEDECLKGLTVELREYLRRRGLKVFKGSVTMANLVGDQGFAKLPTKFKALQCRYWAMFLSFLAKTRCNGTQDLEAQSLHAWQKNSVCIHDNEKPSCIRMRMPNCCLHGGI